MKSTRMFIGIFLGLALSASALAAAPFTVVKRSELKNFKSAPQVLFLQDNYALLKQATAKSSDFEQLYVINIFGTENSKASLSKFGDVLHLQDKSFAVMRVSEEQILALSSKLHHEGMACGVAFKLMGDTVSLAPIADPVPQIGVELKVPQMVQAVAAVESSKIKGTIEELSSIHTRYHSSATGKRVGELLTTLYQQHAQNRDDVTITTFDHGGATGQPSLHVRIQGQSKPNEIVVLGSHIDSVNWSGGSAQRAPGADDNASGTATNLEIFRILMEKGIRLERTLEIHGYAAEEIGLVGSQDMARKYKAAAKNVIAMMQIDMNLYSASATDKIWFVTNNTNSGLNTALSKLITSYLNVEQGQASLSGGDSDHTSWTRNGYAAAFPFENPSNYNHKIHTSGDTIENSGRFSQAAEFARLGLAYVMHFGGVRSN